MSRRYAQQQQPATDDDIQRGIHAEIVEYAESIVRRNQPHSPALSVGAFDACDKTIEHLVIPVEGTNRLDLFQFCDDWRACPVPGIGLDQQKDADGFFQYYLHVPWVRLPEPAMQQAQTQMRRHPAGRRHASAKSFSAGRLQAWAMGVALTCVFALAKGPYLGW